MVHGEGETAACPVCAVKNSYENGVTDEFVIPTVIEGGAKIQPNDSVIFYNFRPDRAREITRTLVDPDFSGFERRNGFFAPISSSSAGRVFTAPFSIITFATPGEWTLPQEHVKSPSEIRSFSVISFTSLTVMLFFPLFY
jgi:hypothetical protein